MPRISPALTFGPTLVDWQDRIDVTRMRTERSDRMKGILKARGVASMLVSGGDDCRYLTGLKGAEFFPQLWYVLFFAEGEPVVFAHAGYHVQQPQEIGWIREWRLARAWLGGICGPEAAGAEADRFADEILAELRRRGVAGEQMAAIGIDELGLQALRSKGVRVGGGRSLMLEATAIKSQDEVNCLKMACAVAEAAWYQTLPRLRPGVSEDQLVRWTTDAAYAAGADRVFAGFRSGPMTFERGMNVTSRILQPGELMYSNLCGTSFLGYRCCLYRTFFVGGQPTQRARDWYSRLVERLDAVIDAIRPGATTADAARHFPPASTWGYEDEAAVLTIEIGHGVGIHQYEMPLINLQWSLEHPQTFEPGMVIAVEGREGAPGEGGVRLENMVVVTGDGAEVIDRFPRDAITAVPWV